MIPVVALLLNFPLSSHPCKRFFLYTADSEYPQDKNPPFGRTGTYDMMMLTKHLNKQSPTLLYRPAAVQGTIYFFLLLLLSSIALYSHSGHLSA